MKRSSSSDSMSGAGDMGLVQLRPPSDEKRVYRRLGSFQSILDGVDEGPEEMLGDGDDELCSPGAGGGVDSFGSSEKKRRLSTEQVKALERYFEVENKLEPERKSKLAQELGLQPRQVAVWFQNRRARWKTKQLERDYNALKSNYDNLKQNYDALHNENEALLTELKELKVKLAADGGESSYCSIKEEPVVAPKEEQATEKMVLMGEGTEDDEGDLEMEPPALIYKDGSSESDSSAILNGDTSPRHLSATAISSSSGILFDHHSLQEELDQPPQSMFLGFNCNPSSASSSPSFPCPDSGRNNRFGYYYCPQQQFKVEEHGFFSAEDPSTAACFFADETPPNLSWYCSDQWN